MYYKLICGFESPGREALPLTLALDDRDVVAAAPREYGCGCLSCERLAGGACHELPSRDAVAP